MLTLFDELPLPITPASPAPSTASCAPVVSDDAEANNADAGGDTSSGEAGAGTSAEPAIASTPRRSPEPAAVPTGASAPAVVGAPAEMGTRVTPIDALTRALEIERRRHRAFDWHPRDDKLWLTREGAAYQLSVRRGAQQFRMTPEAVRELASLLDVSSALLDRMGALAKLEDCRLLNLLLWAEGARADQRYQFKLKEGSVVAVRSATFVPLDPLLLMARLAQEEAQGKLRLRRYDIGASSLWLELEFVGLPSADLNPAIDRTTGKPDIWRPGVVVLTQEDGSRAVTVVPALLRDWGQLALPVVGEKGAVKKRRHAHATPESLVRAVVADVAAAREAAFAEAVDHLHETQQRFLPRKDLAGYIDSLNLPAQTHQVRDGIVRHVEGGRATFYRLLTGTLKEARGLADVGRRLQLVTAMGRHLIVRGRKGAKEREKAKQVATSASARPGPVASDASPPPPAVVPVAPAAVPVVKPSVPAQIQSGPVSGSSLHVPKATKRPDPNARQRRPMRAPPIAPSKPERPS